MDSIKQKIQELFDLSGDNIHSICFGNKIKNDTELEEPSIVYFVYEKLPLDKIHDDEKIPSTIEIDGKKYKTDVIENSGFKAATCYSPTDPKVLLLQSKQRPLSGGLEITNFFNWVETDANTFDTHIGTLGLIAVDNENQTLVGLTNSHVAVLDAFNSSERDINLELLNIRDSKEFISEFEGGFNGTYTPRILQGDSGSLNLENDIIGRQKKYEPLSLVNTNYVDAALITVNSSVIDSRSSSQAELTYSSGVNFTLGLPFATTQEIDGLGVGGLYYRSKVFNVGRSSGPKGYDCILTVQYVSSTTSVGGYYKQGNDVIVDFSDVIKFKFLDNSTDPIIQGDSGSILIAEFGTTKKIIGLVFANNLQTSPNYGLACRIDRVASALNISAWNGTPKSFTPDEPTVSYIFRPYSETRKKINYDGKTYWQAGLISVSDDITDI